MSKWLDRLREHEKNRHMHQNGTDKIDRMPSKAISSVLSVRNTPVSANFSVAAMNDDQARFEERAAILEYDAGLSREEAERLARIEVRATLH